ncbi:MAG: SPOR domain-containing protein [Pararhodobacter sp.]
MDRLHSTAFPRLATVSVVALAAALSLGACQMTQGAESTATGVPQATGGARDRVIERDVEAPDVFQAQEAALWDGRPSLGGVWVAHPGAQDPERVMIRNPATGSTVIGALFRRERDNPGPRFQVSSEAASALGLLAGAPAEIQVTALRLQRVEMEIEPATEPVTAAEETLAIAAAPASVPTGAPTGAPTGQVTITDVDPQPAPRRGLAGLFSRGEPAPQTAAIGQTPLSAPDGVPVAQVATPQATTPQRTAAAPEPERRGLRNLFRSRETAPDTTLIPLPEAAPVQTAAAPQPAPAAAPAPAPAPAAARIDRPYVQIGIFSVEQNAVNARAQMQQQGLTAEIRRGQVGENSFWRVVVGPAGSTTERGQILQRVQALGFADAYAVVR